MVSCIIPSHIAMEWSALQSTTTLTKQNYLSKSWALYLEWLSLVLACCHNPKRQALNFLLVLGWSGLYKVYARSISRSYKNLLNSYLFWNNIYCYQHNIFLLKSTTRIQIQMERLTAYNIKWRGYSILP